MAGRTWEMVDSWTGLGGFGSRLYADLHRDGHIQEPAFADPGVYQGPVGGIISAELGWVKREFPLMVDENPYLY